MSGVDGCALEGLMVGMESALCGVYEYVYWGGVGMAGEEKDEMVACQVQMMGSWMMGVQAWSLSLDLLRWWVGGWSEGFLVVD